MKLCIDCKHLHYSERFGHMCNRPDIISLLNGQKTSRHFALERISFCGPEGKYWEEKEIIPAGPEKPKSRLEKFIDFFKRKL